MVNFVSCSYFVIVSISNNLRYCCIFKEMRILAELEDITTSVDVHQVYAKVKCTVGVVSVSNHIRR